MLDETPKKDILIVQGDWNAKVGEYATKDWKGICGPYSNSQINWRGLLLLEFASYNDLFLTNTFGPHKPSRRWTWHSPNGKTHNQIDYIMVKKRFRSSVNINRTRSFPGADVGSDHEHLMMTFRLRLKKIIKPTNTRIKYDLEKLKEPRVAKVFQAKIGGKFAPLILLENENNDIDNNLVTAMNIAVTETANEILGKHRRIKKPWVTSDILDLCDKRRELKNKKGDTDGRERYKRVNTEIRNIMKKAKEKCIKKQCVSIENDLKNNNTKRAYQTVKELTNTKQRRVSVIQDNTGKRLTEEHDVLTRFTVYCSDLYNHESNGDTTILNGPYDTNDDKFPILREEVEVAVKYLKGGKSPGNDNIPAELIKNGGEAMISALTIICNKIWKTGEWPTPWTKSMIITLPKKGNIQICNNYRTISLISHPSKVMLKVLLNRLKPQAERSSPKNKRVLE